MRASLADQPGLAVALGANLPSPAGDPSATLVAVRPQLEALLQHGWAGLAGAPLRLRCQWSPLFATAPVGGPADQPTYCNAVVVCSPEVVADPGAAPEPALAPATAVAPTLAAAQALLQALHRLEQRYGRQRRERWGPRSLDLDLLWWGDLASASPGLELPHPRWHTRAFVLAPLRAIERRRGAALACPHPAGLPLEEVAMAEVAMAEPWPVPLPPRPGWPE